MPGPGSAVAAAVCRAALRHACRTGRLPIHGHDPVLETVSLTAAYGLPSAEATLRAYVAQSLHASAPTVQDCVRQFMAVKAGEGCRLITLHGYRSCLRSFAKRFGARRPGTISALELADHLNHWESPTTRGNHWLKLREFYRWLIAVRYAWANPVPAAMAHPLPLGHRGLFYTPAEAGGILRRTFDTDQIGFWVLALFSGLRSMEIKRLSQQDNPWSWFNPLGRVIAVPAHAAKVKHRHSPMHPILPPWLEWLRRENRPFWPKNSERVLTQQRREVIGLRLGVPPDQVPERFNRLGYSNMARRAFITYGLALKGASYAEVARRAGNSENVIRVFYRRFATRQEAEAYFQLTPEWVRHHL